MVFPLLLRFSESKFSHSPLNRHCQENTFECDVCYSPIIQSCTLNATSVSVILSFIRLWTQIRNSVSPCTCKVPGKPMTVCCEWWMWSSLDRRQCRPRAVLKNNCLMKYLCFFVTLSSKCCIRTNSLKENKYFYSSFASGLGEGDPRLQLGLHLFQSEERAKQISRQAWEQTSQNDAKMIHKKLTGTMCPKTPSISMNVDQV